MYAAAACPAGIVNVADAVPPVTVPDTAVPKSGVNSTVPPFTVPADDVTFAVSVTVCDDPLYVAVAALAVVVVPAGLMVSVYATGALVPPPLLVAVTEKL